MRPTLCHSHIATTGAGASAESGIWRESTGQVDEIEADSFQKSVLPSVA